MENSTNNSDQDTKKPVAGGFQRLMQKLGFSGEKIEITTVSAAELEKKMKSSRSLVLLDVREERELNDRLGHIKGILNIPVWHLKNRINELDDKKENDIVIVCRSGARAVKAAKTLKIAGFPNVDILSGGMMEWNRHLASR